MKPVKANGTRPPFPAPADSPESPRTTGAIPAVRNFGITLTFRRGLEQEPNLLPQTVPARPSGGRL